MDESISSADSLMVVALGASAGGIRALRSFFEHVPPDSGVAYVVILHLSPNHESQLASVLQAKSNIPVVQVSEHTRLERNHVYVAPPDKHPMMEAGKLIVSPNEGLEDRRTPVDIFFRSLADSHLSKAVCVILSGTGSDGSLGLKRVKEQGGIVIAQSPREAEFGDMPRNAIATGLVDEVLPVAEIPDRIGAYRTQQASFANYDQIPEESADKKALREVFMHLRERTGHDFTNYKPPTLLRRLGRRISVRKLPDIPSYVAYLRDDPRETEYLLKDLLISVTNFFRDPQTFETLEQEVIPKLLKGKTAADDVRVWVVGCATGEEAYSLAMLLVEHTDGLLDTPSVQLFATDIDEFALATAREGVYSITDAADVSQARLERFFKAEGDRYRVRREIRDKVLFARHNVLDDPPFSRLDLVSCRNLLIYLNQTAQARVMETMHFALKPGGFLLLGNSESVDAAADLYAPVSRKKRIYRSRSIARREYALPGPVSSSAAQAGLRVGGSNKGSNENLTFGGLHGRLLETYAPPSLIVDPRFELMHLSERAGRYLRLPAGEPSESLLSLIRPELRSELRTALTRAVELRQNVRSRPVTVGEETVTLHVRPVLEQDDAARGFLLVMFEELGNDTASDTPAAVDEPIVKQLETEIDNLRMELSASTSHHETQTEELRASNEELQALNEELRSAAEELETSKEELQSINEELTTVNQELKVQIEETSIVSNNLQNLIDSTDFGVIFLDRNLRVQLFSPASRAVFNLIGSDIGRPLADITYNIEYAHVLKDAAEVLRSLTPVEREVRTSDDHFYLMRVVLYRTSEDRINGVVLTFVDISKRKQAEEALRQLNETLEQQVVERTEAWRNTRTSFQQAFEAGPTASVITSLDDDRFIEVNAAFTDMTGYTLDEVKGRSARDLGMWSSSRDKEKIEAALTGRDGYRHLQLHLRTKSGAVLDILKSCERVKMDGVDVWLKMFLDITERNRTQEQLMQSIEAVMTDSDWFRREVMERLSSARSGGEASSSLEQLTGRELEILRHVAAGSNDKEIAAALGLRVKTVRNHINNVYSKLGVHSRVEALVWARERGVMDSRD